MKPLDRWVWGQRPMVHHEQTCEGKFAEESGNDLSHIYPCYLRYLGRPAVIKD